MDTGNYILTMRRQLARTLFSHRGISANGHGGRDPNALIIIPGSLNHFYNQTGQRIATALSNLGFTVALHTLQSAPTDDFDWCLLVSIPEIVISYGDRDAAIRRIINLRTRVNHIAAVALDCVRTWWFASAAQLCRESEVDVLFDFGLHDQSEYLEWRGAPRYHFIFNGFTEPERRQVQRGPSDERRTIPWVFVGHQTRQRSNLVRQLVKDVDPGGFVYMPYLTPFTEDGPHLNEQQLLTVLEHARYQVWCSHHEWFYMEGERFRQSILAGGVPIKALASPPDTTQSLPFAYLLVNEEEVAETLQAMDFAAVRQRAIAEICALPMLEESLLQALVLVGARKVRGNGR